MKNNKILLAMLAIALVFVGCGDSGAGDDGQTSRAFSGKDRNGSNYILSITKAAGRAAYTPKAGDTYVLTIIDDEGDVKTSSGTVIGLSGGEWILEPAAEGSKITFTIKTTEGGIIKSIKGKITMENGDTIDVEETLTPPDVVEKAFVEVWRYFGSPEIHSWIDTSSSIPNIAFPFYNGSFNNEHLNKAKAYWDSLPKTVYQYYWTDCEQPEDLEQLVFELQLRHDDWNNGDALLQLEINYPVSGKRWLHILSAVVPEKVLEIAKGMVASVK
jgi:hypothetical protein